MIQSTDLLTTIYMVAITAEAMSGALAAGRRSMDLFGVAVIAFVTALGGGTVRDVILGNYPIGWTQHATYIYLVLGAGLFTVIVAQYMHHIKRLFLMLDAMGLVAFSLIGANVALQMNYDPMVIIMAGMITGIFGGVLRDLLCGQIPVVFQREIYAMVSLVVCVMFLGLRHLGVDADHTTLVCFAVGLMLRLAAIRFKWGLPTFAYGERWD